MSLEPATREEIAVLARRAGLKLANVHFEELVEVWLCRADADAPAPGPVLCRRAGAYLYAPEVYPGREMT